MNDDDFAQLFLKIPNSEPRMVAGDGLKELSVSKLSAVVTPGDGQTKKSVIHQVVDNECFILKMTPVTDSNRIRQAKEDDGSVMVESDLLEQIRLESVTGVTTPCNQLTYNNLMDDGLFLGSVISSETHPHNRFTDNGLTDDGQSVTRKKAEGGVIGMDNFVQAVQPGGREEGPVHPVSQERGDREGDGEFLRLLDPDFKPDFLFRPGDYLPPWAADCLGSWPELPDEWWGNENFRLSAAGAGHHRRPPKRPTPAVDPTTGSWESIAREVISWKIKVAKTSEFKAIEIGLRAINYSRICRQAVALIDLSDL